MNFKQAQRVWGRLEKMVGREITDTLPFFGSES